MADSFLPTLCSLTQIFDTYAANILGIVRDIFCLHKPSLLSCLDLTSVFRGYRPDKYVFKKKRKKQEGKRNIDLHRKTCKRKEEYFLLADNNIMCFSIRLRSQQVSGLFFVCPLIVDVLVVLARPNFLFH